MYWLLLTKMSVKNLQDAEILWLTTDIVTLVFLFCSIVGPYRALIKKILLEMSQHDAIQVVVNERIFASKF